MSHLTAHDIAILDRALVRLQNHMEHTCAVQRKYGGTTPKAE
jgi:hypothetical protein